MSTSQEALADAEHNLKAAVVAEEHGGDVLAGGGCSDSV